jgi:hypothetical protein
MQMLLPLVKFTRTLDLEYGTHDAGQIPRLHFLFHDVVLGILVGGIALLLNRMTRCRHFGTAPADKHE